MTLATHKLCNKLLQSEKNAMYVTNNLYCLKSRKFTHRDWLVLLHPRDLRDGVGRGRELAAELRRLAFDDAIAQRSLEDLRSDCNKHSHIIKN